MKKILFTLVVFVLCLYAGPNQEVDATSLLGNPDPMAQACAANYDRMAPRFCVRTTITTATTLVAGASCQTIVPSTTWGIPTSAIHLILLIDGHIYGSNIVQLDSLTVNFYQDSACTSQSPGAYKLLAREWLAVNNIDVIEVTLPILVHITSDHIYFKMSQVGGVSTTALISIYAYWD